MIAEHPKITSRALVRAEVVALEFDKQRDCGWNSSNNMCRYDDAPEYCAADVKPYASLGDQCHGTLHELALLHTLRPCKDCGSDHLYFGYYKVACCSCLGDRDECEDCQDGGCGNCAENMNLPDAITRWNLHHGDNGTRGRVTCIG